MGKSAKDILERYKKIVELKEQGKTTTEISQAVGVSEVSVRRYLRQKPSRIKRKKVATKTSAPSGKSVEWYKEQLKKAHILLLQHGLIEMEVEL